MRLSIRLLTNSNWHLIYYGFGVIAAYCSNFRHFAFSSHPLGRIGLPLLVLIKLLPLDVTAESLQAKRDQKSAISLQRGQSDPKFQVQGVAPPPVIIARLAKPMNNLQRCRWQFSHKETLQQIFSSEVRLFYGNRQFCVFETPFGGLRGNVRRSS